MEYIRIYGFYRWILPVEYCVKPLSTYGGKFVVMQLLESHGPGKVKPPKGLRCARSRARMPPVRMLLALTRKQVHRSAQHDPV